MSELSDKVLLNDIPSTSTQPLQPMRPLQPSFTPLQLSYSSQPLRYQDYTECLLKNLSVDKVNNPEYLCKEFSPKQCEQLKNFASIQDCKTYWSKIC